MSLRFEPAADPATLPEAWGPLQHALYRWLRQSGAQPGTAALAAWTSLAEHGGHTALDLHQPPFAGVQFDAATLASARADAAFVGDGSGAPRALVLDGDARLALWRNHADEQALAAALRARRDEAPADADADALDLLFQGRRDADVRPQRDAVAGVVGRRLFVLTGGPGTGKTTTVLRMLLMLQRRRATPLRVSVCAPTGKAAQRLRQALRDGRRQLAEGDPARGLAPLPADWHDALACIPDGEALTLHRLLAFEPHADRFARNADNPVPADVVVVDEASMADLAMTRVLLDALRPDALLVLVGDADQLTSVAAGSVLMDVVGAFEGSPQLVRLTHSFRAEWPLQQVNAAVRAGDAAALHAAVDASRGSVRVRPVADAAALQRRLDAWADALAALPVRGPAATPADALAALRALAGRQLLCALREDVFGAQAANARIEARLRQAWAVPATAEWYPGRAVLITRNDYDAGLFNGDVGLCLADPDGTLRVWFEAVLPDGGVGARDFAPGLLPAHEGAFAITIHKSQGSEYAHVAVLLPPDAGHRILSRQLLYTGASRARTTLELWSGEAALAAALATPVRRMGGLAAKLAGATP